MPKVSAPPEASRGRHPYLRVDLGDWVVENFGDAGGLTQFGVYAETLRPGAASSVRHWHENEDEFLYVLSGRPTLVEDETIDLAPGDAVAWPAGRPVAHRIENRTAADVRYLVVGTRAARDRWHYPDQGVTGEKDGERRLFLDAQGRPMERESP